MESLYPFSFFVDPYFFSPSWSSVRTIALASCLRLWEASLRLRAHGRVGASDDGGRFLRQVVEEIVGKQKTANPQK
jgi:hypothetical protein